MKEYWLKEAIKKEEQAISRNYVAIETIQIARKQIRNTLLIKAHIRLI